MMLVVCLRRETTFTPTASGVPTQVNPLVNRSALVVGAISYHQHLSLSRQIASALFVALATGANCVLLMLLQAPLFVHWALFPRTNFRSPPTVDTWCPYLTGRCGSEV